MDFRRKRERDRQPRTLTRVGEDRSEWGWEKQYPLSRTLSHVLLGLPRSQSYLS